MFEIKYSKFKIQNSKFQSGFTLLEIIAVVFIITLGLLGIMSLVNQNVQVGYVNQNRIVASQLCQEGLELARNVRDNNWLLGDDWKNGTSSASDIIQDGTYAIDYTGITDVTDINSFWPNFYIDRNIYYRHIASPGAATTTAYSRVLNVKTETDASTTLECVVQWKTGRNTLQFTAQTILYNWR
jgi:prepilin-type N-terminal cleavage/methylation domain-containing protein